MGCLPSTVTGFTTCIRNGQSLIESLDQRSLLGGESLIALGGHLPPLGPILFEFTGAIRHGWLYDLRFIQRLFRCSCAAESASFRRSKLLIADS